MMGRWKKDVNHYPFNNKLVQEPGVMKKTEAQIQFPMKQR
jgi:hypothetical protein